MTRRLLENSKNNLQQYRLTKIRALLGFAAKSGKIFSGNEAVRRQLDKGTIFLIILAKDASRDIAAYYMYNCTTLGVPIICAGTKYDLGLSIGKSQRAVIGISDQSFAKNIVRKVRENEGMD